MRDSAHHTENLLDRYRKMLAEGQIAPDSAQEEVVQRLYRLQQHLELYELQKRSSFFKKILSGKKAPERPKGLYIYGDVGRGKSMLMDVFYETSSVEKKRRVHFHAFMLSIHRSIHRWRKRKGSKEGADPIPPLAKRLAKRSQLLCFDELQVTDIADAMILGRLFKELFTHGVVVVATSNRPPEDLYKDGLQRSRFEPFIDLLKSQVDVVALAARQDYRLGRLQALATMYYSPLDRRSHGFLEEAFHAMIGKSRPQKTVLDVAGRKLTVAKSSSGVAWMSFDELCRQPLGAADYIEIARAFHTVLLSGIPRMTKEDRNEAKRFVTLIDELYEHKVKFLCTADARPEKLYPKGDGSFEFERTVSRLMEMQSEEYLRAEHRG